MGSASFTAADYKGADEESPGHLRSEHHLLRLRAGEPAGAADPSTATATGPRRGR
jgi:hypothetical protein